MNGIPDKEEAALRAAFETQMSETFGWIDFTRTTEHGYKVPQIKAAWFACRCGWLTGSTYGVDVPLAPTEEVIGYVHKDWEPTQGQGRIYGHRPGSDYVPVTHGVLAVDACCGRTMPYGFRCTGCPHAKAGDTLVPRVHEDPNPPNESPDGVNPSDGGQDAKG